MQDLCGNSAIAGEHGTKKNALASIRLVASQQPLCQVVVADDNVRIAFPLRQRSQKFKR